MRVQRFGPGYRRPERAGDSHGVTSALLHAASGVRVTEIALAERAAFGPLRSSSDALLVVIEGGGWLAVADERQRVAVGESIEIPSGAERLLVTDGVPLRAIFIEFSFAPQLQQADAPNGSQAEE